MGRGREKRACEAPVDPRWRRVCGIDEVGRGPLAGPVVASAVVLPRDFDCRGIADSKTIEPEERRALAGRILAEAVVSVASASAATIDRVNIRQASLWAMGRALQGLAFTPDVVLCDGCDLPPGLAAPGFPLVRGDGMSACVAAASIVAKVIRDDLMTRLGQRFPQYGFERHKGYATPEHRAALLRHGPSVHHRRSFRPVREAMPRAVPA